MLGTGWWLTLALPVNPTGKHWQYPWLGWDMLALVACPCPCSQGGRRHHSAILGTIATSIAAGSVKGAFPSSSWVTRSLCLYQSLAEPILETKRTRVRNAVPAPSWVEHTNLSTSASIGTPPQHTRSCLWCRQGRPHTSRDKTKGVLTPKDSRGQVTAL